MINFGEGGTIIRRPEHNYTKEDSTKNEFSHKMLAKNVTFRPVQIGVVGNIEPQVISQHEYHLREKNTAHHQKIMNNVKYSVIFSV